MLTSAPVMNFESLHELGVSAEVGGKMVYLGGIRLLETMRFHRVEALDQFAQSITEKGQEAIFMVYDGTIIAVLAFEDVIRPESKRAIDELRKLGVQVAMLTEDSDIAARAMADRLGIERFYARVLRERKQMIVEQLRQEGFKVAFVTADAGDNSALEKANVGIAIGANIEHAAADVLLVRNNPLDVVKLILLSRTSHRQIITNVTFAITYNLLALPLAAGVLAPWGVRIGPVMAALFMSLSTSLVALNAQFLRNLRLPGVEPVKSAPPAGASKASDKTSPRKPLRAAGNEEENWGP